jgi:two-component system alkaline phosphatase synthesis response regulator PhoP
MLRILIVEDEPQLARGLRNAFEHHGFDVVTAADGQAGLDLALSEQPSLIVLDLMLPKRDGTEVCRELRARSVHTPIIMLTARSQESDRLEGFDVGADDYVTKPFSIRELIARAQAVLRRAAPSAGPLDQVQIGQVTIDFKQYVVVNGRHRHALTPLELRLLRLFLDHPGDVVTRERLLNEIWGFEAFPTTRTVDTFMLRLRRKIEPDPRRPAHFLTVYGAGYRFVP